MKKTITIFLVLLSALVYCSETIELSFIASGEASEFDSIRVENVNQDEMTILYSNETLELEVEVSGFSSTEALVKKLIVFPNPMTDKATISFPMNNSGMVEIAITDMTGRKIVSNKYNLDNSLYYLSVSGLPKGNYIVSVFTPGEIYYSKVLSLNLDASNPAISLMGHDEFPVQTKSAFKKAQTSNTLPYKVGDCLKLTGMSDYYTTTISCVPHKDTTLTINFVECVDIQGNYYPSVVIGQQTWMAANLKATMFNDSTPIQQDTVNETWKELATPAYCWFNNDSLTYSEPHGALYNWFVVDSASNDNKNVCPEGWHVPLITEWRELSDNLGGASVSGGKLKETGNEYWKGPNSGAINSTGFSAYGSGWRTNNNGEFAHLNMYGCMWSATNASDEQSHYVEFMYDSKNLLFYKWGKTSGFSVRCLMDEE